MPHSQIKSITQKLEFTLTLLAALTLWGMLLFFGPFHYRFGARTLFIATGIAITVGSIILFAIASFFLKRKWMLWTSGLVMMAMGLFLLGDLPYMFSWTGSLGSIVALLPLINGMLVIIYARKLAKEKRRLKQQQAQTPTGQQQHDPVESDDQKPKSSSSDIKSDHVIVHEIILSSSSRSRLSSCSTSTFETVSPETLRDAEARLRRQIWIAGSYFSLVLVTAIVVILVPSLPIAQFAHSTHELLSLYMGIPVTLCLFGLVGVIRRNKLMVVPTGVLVVISILAGAFGSRHLLNSFQSEGFSSWVVVSSISVTVLNFYISHVLFQIWTSLQKRPTSSEDSFDMIDEYDWA